MARRQPTAPKDMTPAMLEKAFLSPRRSDMFASRDPIKDRERSRAPGKPKRASPLLTKAVAKISEPLPDEYVGPVHPSAYDGLQHVKREQLTLGMANGITRMIESHGQVKTAKQRYITQSLPPKRGKAIAGETPERQYRAANGLERERMNADERSIRVRVALPFRLTSTKVMEAANALIEPVRQIGRPKNVTFDKVLNFGDGPNIRWALSKYIEDHDIAFGRSKGSYNIQMTYGRSSPHDRLPVTEDQEQALRTIRTVNSYLGTNDRKAAKDLVETYIEINPYRDHLSIVDYVTKIAGITHEAYAEGYYMGYYSNLGLRLYDIYRIERVAKECEIKLAA